MKMGGEARRRREDKKEGGRCHARWSISCHKIVCHTSMELMNFDLNAAVQNPLQFDDFSSTQLLHLEYLYHYQ